ncbi:MAG: FG-GAP-like repeat-containing protein [Ignavibacteria bacterium]|nr:FG-GAP-like repeat-containing protein [Ignavibacteria bacterium]
MKTLFNTLKLMIFLMIIIAGTANAKSDSLPLGVTRDWLNSLTNENGQKLMQPEEEGDAMQERFLTGFAASDNFGISVSTAGDVNGDGYSDLIIGAPLNDGGASNAGRAYIYYGGAIINSGVDVILTGLTAGDQFGYSVSSAGDVNGDGYSDVIVGANLNDGGASNAGRAYIYFGGSSMNNVADIILTGAAASDNFGTSVSAAGDVNGDGFSDVIVGANLNDAGGTSAGRAYIFLGGSSMNNVADVILTGVAASDNFGFSVSTAGDVNGDGYSDVIAGATGNDAGGTNAGRAYIYFGGSTMNDIADVLLTGEAVSDGLGVSVSTAGDVNGDGFSDVIVGANLNDAGGADAGRAYIYFGGSSPDNTADLLLTGVVAGDRLGSSVSTAGDVNGDGYSDVIVGAIFNDAGGSNAGRAFIFFGSSNLNNTPDFSLTGEAANDNFGSSVSLAGDMNGDGYSDIIVGALANDAGGTNAGRAYLFTNSMTGTDIADEIFTGATAGDNFGNAISSAGDFNGDGFADIAISAYQNDAGGIDAGRVYIYFGSSALDNVADVILTGAAAGDQFGFCISVAGDVNADGYTDLIVGANGSDSGGTNSGRAYIYLGESVPDAIPDVIMTGAAAGDALGFSVSSAGDFNGDGFSDVIVGSNLSDAFFTDGGAAYIYYGGITINNVADVIIQPTGSNDRLGYSVSSAGDVNGDGYSDVIVGAYLDDNTFVDDGSAFVYFGGSLANNLADMRLKGENVSDQFGISVSSAGDVNNDGYSDIIVGANGHDLGGQNSGSAFLYFGGYNPDIIPDLILTGSSSGDNFGWSVSEALDVNADGYGDIVISTPFNDVGGTEAGRCYVYFGGKSPDNISDIIMTGEANSNFGFDVSSAGDMNGDGYSDIIIGALANDAAGTDAGRTYLYLSSSPSVKPIFNTLRDVPNDQGGQMFLKWARSGYDVNNSSTITDYIVYRSYPPSGGQFSWEARAVIPATNRPFYTFTDNTPFDSSTGNSGTMYYQIMARTSNSSQYWLSGILSGRSIDNIAPLMVSPFTAAPVVNNVLLNWNRSTSSDLLNYVLYRSTSPMIDPDTEPVFATTTDSTYLDTAPLSGVYYYFIVAQDIHNNKSPVAIAESPNMTLNLTMFIEGFYNAGSNSQVSDTIQVELRNSTAPFAVADQSKAVVSSNGTVQLKFGNASNGSYYIAVKHRSSIETWSAGTIALSRTTPANYDISASSSQAFGSNMIQVDTSPVRFAIFGGDVNQDGTVDATDVSMIDNDAQNFVGGYVVTDLTGDDFVDGTDFAIADNNAGNFVSVVRP